MREAHSADELRPLPPPERTRVLSRSDILAFVFGTALIAGFIGYVIQRDYRTTLNVWRSQLSTEVRYLTWTLTSSLQQSQDDAHVLARLAPIRELLLAGTDGNSKSLPRSALQEHVLNLFDDYRRVYEYAALYLLDDRGRVALNATDSSSWSTVVRSPAFAQTFGSVIRSGHYSVALARSPEHELSLIFMMPVFSGITTPGLNAPRPVGAVAILDPFSRELLPLLLPRLPTRTGETIFLRLPDVEERYKSPRRNGAAGLSDRIHAPDTLIRAAASATEDRVVFDQFFDDRGDGVMAAMQKIPSIDSVLVSRVDSSEALADFHRTERVEMMSGVVAVLALVGMILVRRRNAVVHEMRESLRRQEFVKDTLASTVAERTSQLAEMNQQLHLVLEAAEMGAWEYRFDGDSGSWDGRCDAIFGISTGGRIDYHEAIARIHPDDRAATTKAVRQAISGASGGLFDQEFRVVWPDGSVHWVASHGRVFFEGDGEHRRAVLLVGGCMEITGRRYAEERLRHTQKLESIGLLARGIAHDFNNLLTVIMGNASAALSECSSCEHAQGILSASEQAASLTKQLLAYAGKGHTITKLVDLTELVSESKELLAASVPRRLTICSNLARDLPYVEADPSQIEQILMNLVINAGEATPPKQDGRIEITTGHCEVTPDVALRHSTTYDVAAGAYVSLEVRDNGTGMDDATISNIFDPFFSTKFTGRGLGLAAVHGIVSASGGFIDVESSPGVGTTFRVFLPASNKTRTREPESEAPREQHRGYSTILVVDDEEMVRKLACMTLRHCGYAVLEASNGKDALELLANAPSLPSVALIDLAMPSMGGDELAPILANKYPNMKIIISSGYPEEDARKGFASASVAGFMQKPYTVTALAEKVGEALGVGLSSGRIIEFPRTG